MPYSERIVHTQVVWDDGEMVLNQNPTQKEYSLYVWGPGGNCLALSSPTADELKTQLEEAYVPQIQKVLADWAHLTFY